MSVHTTPPHLAEPAGQLGSCALSPSGPVVAGQFGTWTITYTAGQAGIAPGGGIAVVPPCHNGLRWRAGQVVAGSTGRGGVSLSLKHCAPLSYHNQQFPIVFVTVEGAPLAPGEQIRVTLGDPGAFISGFVERARAQELAMPGAAFQVLVDPLGNARYSNPRYPGGQPLGYRLLPDSPKVDVMPGPPRRLAVVAPAHVAPGEPFDVLVRAEDDFGNPCTALAGEITLGLPPAALGGPSTVTLGAGSGAVRAGPFRLQAAPGGGPARITAQSAAWQLLGASNPIQVVAVGALRIFFGDLHAHAVNRFGAPPAPAPLAPHALGTYQEAYAYARAVAGLDFVGLATFHSREEGHWARYQALTHEVHTPGRFVPLLAVEVADRRAGHRVLLFPGDTAPDVADGALPDLWRALDGTGALAIPHHTNASSEGGPQSWEVQDWSLHDARCQTVVEITQNRGAFERDRPDVDDPLAGATVIGGRGASVQDALARGCRLGFAGGTDNHYGQPGSSRCAKGGVDFHDRVTGGLTAVLAPELTREALVGALRARRCYATTGDRILLDVTLNGHPMGSDLPVDLEGYPARRFAIRVAGTYRISSVELLRNNEVVFTARPGGDLWEGEWTDAAPLGPLALSPVFSGDRPFVYYYLRVTQANRQRAWASPFWLTQAAGAA